MSPPGDPAHSRAAERILALAGREHGYRPVTDGPWWAWLAPFAARRLTARLVAQGALVRAEEAEGRPVYRIAAAPSVAPRARPRLPEPDAALLREILEPLALVALRHPPNPVRPDVYRTVRVRLDLLRRAQDGVFPEMTLSEAWEALEARDRDGVGVNQAAGNPQGTGPQRP